MLPPFPPLCLQTYPFVGRLLGAFYDGPDGKETSALASVHARAAGGEAARAKREAEQTTWPTCNSRWNEEEGAVEWWLWWWLWWCGW